jgi:DNA-binding transcriptional LysR family regulator
VNLRELEVFNALMKTGTTVGAASSLFLSQPAVSKILKHLEARTGLKLFDRVSGRLRPTPEGHTLYRHVRNVFTRLETIDRVAQDIRGGRNGVISVAATPTIANTLLAEAVGRFRKTHADARVIFRSIRTPDVARRVAEGEADFGVVHQPLDKAGLEAEALLPVEIVCLVPRRHRLAGALSVTLADLAEETLVSYRPGTGIGNMIGAAFRAAGIEKSIDIQTSLSATAGALVARGDAIGLHDPFHFLAVNAPDLVIRRVVPAMRISVELLFSRDHPSSSIAARLMTEIRTVASEMTQRFASIVGTPAATSRPRTQTSSRQGLSP